MFYYLKHCYHTLNFNITKMKKVKILKKKFVKKPLKKIRNILRDWEKIK